MTNDLSAGQNKIKKFDLEERTAKFGEDIPPRQSLSAEDSDEKAGHAIFLAGVPIGDSSGAEIKSTKKFQKTKNDFYYLLLVVGILVRN